MTQWVAVQKIYSKMHRVSCTNNTHHDVIIDSENHSMFKNTKTWISWEWYIPFRWNKTILNLCLRLQILRNYHFVPFSRYSSFCIFKHTMIRYNNRWKTEAIKNRILLDLSTICYIVDVSNKLSKYLSVISLELTGILIFLLCVSSDMGTNSLSWLKAHTPISNLKLK